MEKSTDAARRITICPRCSSRLPESGSEEQYPYAVQCDSCKTTIRIEKGTCGT